MSDFGVKVSLPGYDVKTATPEQCSVHSDYANPKVKVAQTPAHFNIFTKSWSSNPGAGETTLLTVAHGYSYVPAVVCFIKYASGGNNYFQPLPYGTPAYQYQAYSNSTNFIIIFNSDGTHDPTGESYQFKYFILAESGA